MHESQLSLYKCSAPTQCMAVCPGLENYILSLERINHFSLIVLIFFQGGKKSALFHKSEMHTFKIMFMNMFGALSTHTPTYYSAYTHNCPPAPSSFFTLTITSSITRSGGAQVPRAGPLLYIFVMGY